MKLLIILSKLQHARVFQSLRKHKIIWRERWVYVCFAALEDKREKPVKQDEVVARGTAYNTVVRPSTADGNSFPLYRVSSVIQLRIPIK